MKLNIYLTRLLMDHLVQTKVIFSLKSNLFLGSISCQKTGEQSGKCFIENLALVDNSQITLQFYSNSFSYSDGTNRYYLFGVNSDTKVKYGHILKVYNQIVVPQTESNNIYTYGNYR